MKIARLIAICLFLLSPVPALAQNTPLKVVATFSILEDIAKQIGGEDIIVQSLVAPDTDLHAYRPSPKDSKKLSEADIVIENGLGLEGWINRLVSASGFHGVKITASQGVKPIPAQHNHAHEDTEEHAVDPHAWQDVSNVRIYAKNIAEALATAIPAKAKAIQARATAYDAKLAELDAWTKKEIASIPKERRKIITSHDAFGYFEHAYGIEFKSPQGINTEIEPTAKQVAQLSEQIKSEKIHVVFFEKQASPKLIRQIAKDTGIEVGSPIYSDSLSSKTSGAPTYIQMFRHNVTQFITAMK